MNLRSRLLNMRKGPSSWKLRRCDHVFDWLSLSGSGSTILQCWNFWWCVEVSSPSPVLTTLSAYAFDHYRWFHLRIITIQSLINLWILLSCIPIDLWDLLFRRLCYPPFLTPSLERGHEKLIKVGLSPDLLVKSGKYKTVIEIGPSTPVSHLVRLCKSDINWTHRDSVHSTTQIQPK